MALLRSSIDLPIAIESTVSSSCAAIRARAAGVIPDPRRAAPQPDEGIVTRPVDTRDVPEGLLYLCQLRGRTLPVAAAKFAAQIEAVLESDQDPGSRDQRGPGPAAPVQHGDPAQMLSTGGRPRSAPGPVEHPEDFIEQPVGVLCLGLWNHPLHEAKLDRDIVPDGGQIVTHQHQIGPAFLAHRRTAHPRGGDLFDLHRDGQAHGQRIRIVRPLQFCMVLPMDASGDTVLVLGLGNTLLRDEAVGVRTAEHLAMQPDAPALGLRCLDGGTMGLSLLIEMEDADALIVIDAARLDADPGTVQVFEGPAMDRFLRTRCRNAHDIGLDDLMDALRLREAVPERRALVGIEPADLRVGAEMTPPVAASVATAASAVLGLVRRWKAGTASPSI
jgi:hydrogenase maturation protease